MRKNVWLKMACVLIASVAWFVFMFRQDTIQKTFILPVEYRNVPAELSIQGPAPSEVIATPGGNERAFQILVPDSMKVTFDLGCLGGRPAQISM